MTHGAFAGRLACVGDLMSDVTALLSRPIAYGSDSPASITIQPGGSAANTAAWAASLGHRSLLVAAIGDDQAGRDLTHAVTALGIEPRLALLPGRRTGACIVIVDSSGERTMLPDPGANAELAYADLGLTPADHLHVSGYALFHEIARPHVLRMIDDAKAAGATVSLDPASSAPAELHRELLLEAAARVDAVLANEAEARVLTGASDPQEACARLGELCGCAVVKLGSSGVTAMWRPSWPATGKGQAVSLPAPAAHALDTTGAGDAFAAAFLPAWRSGLPLPAALQEGQRAAASAISRVGAGPPTPVA